MSDSAKLTIEIKEDAQSLRPNALLDEAFGFGPKVPNPPPLPQRAPNFPGTVAGPDGRSYSIDAYHAAQKRFQGQQKSALEKEAFDNLFGPPKLPAQPPPLPPAAPGFGQQLVGALGGSSLAAAGPIGAAVLGAQQLGQQFKQLQSDVKRTSEMFEGLASNQLPKMGDVADSALDKFAAALPIIGDLVVGPARVANEIAQLPDKLTAAFLQQAKVLAPFSGDISGAQAVADVRKIEADIREAEALGSGLGRMIDAQSRLENTIREFLLPIKKVIVDVLADRLELMAEAVNVGVKLPELLRTVATETAVAIILAMQTEFEKSGKRINELPDKLKKVLNPEEEKGMDLVGAFIREAGNAMRRRQGPAFAG